MNFFSSLLIILTWWPLEGRAAIAVHSLTDWFVNFSITGFGTYIVRLVLEVNYAESKSDLSNFKSVKIFVKKIHFPTLIPKLGAQRAPIKLLTRCFAPCLV